MQKINTFLKVFPAETFIDTMQLYKRKILEFKIRNFVVYIKSHTADILFYYSIDYIDFRAFEQIIAKVFTENDNI